MELRDILSRTGPGLEKIRAHAEEYRNTGKAGRDLAEEISSIKEYSSMEIMEEIKHPCETPDVEDCRRKILGRKNNFLKYTHIITVAAPVFLLLMIAGIAYFGSATQGAKLIYALFILFTLSVFALTAVHAWKVDRAVREYIVACILAYDHSGN